ncbi:UDP-N-acetylglucosamine 2-epimerase [[Clostridium] sordellii]|uniref:UDP-N-acetylglucosamine 2-epimerase n=1 Tax=Paraclostridium sordellii TaxID=1505 RepID=UPI0005E85D48|nr:UDP-N-acetylglucosamine 2-epimerase [Paeniclostridium sordellii]CEN91387.1 UDP-N-acetylglucosamine 2-epimerase [[Clostridium] sordellii] [Paeniclostridium sordellii]
MKKIVFLTGTRADYGKLKSLMKKVEESENFDLHVFVTGMHMLKKYGSTYHEVEKDGFKNIYKHINQKSSSSHQMDIALSNTIVGLSNYCDEIKPDMIVVHGDRLEALAGAIVGAFNNIKVMHIEGGEVSGTIDESIRHSITKMSHFHLVANEEAKKRIIQLGEKEETIFVFGSPDIDIMYSSSLPSIEEVKEKYEIKFENYSILMYHPVTTEVDKLEANIKQVVDAVINSGKNYVVIYPNNDNGSDVILKEYERFRENDRFEIYPSMRFEYFLTLLKECEFIIGNSSSGIRESCVYGKMSIDIGNRQKGRYDENISNIINIYENIDEITNAIKKVGNIKVKPISHFGSGNSDEQFLKIISSDEIWKENIQKKFIDVDF